MWYNVCMRSNETRYCEHCGKPFHPLYRRRSEKPQSFCSRQCQLANRWGTTQPNECQFCGNDISHTGKRSQKYCSVTCRVAAQVGRANPGRSNRITKICAWCGDEFSRPASDFHGDKAFCSYGCMAEWQSEFVNGVSHPRWKGGPPRTYGIGWRVARLCDGAFWRRMPKVQETQASSRSSSIARPFLWQHRGCPFSYQPYCSLYEVPCCRT